VTRHNTTVLRLLEKCTPGASHASARWGVVYRNDPSVHYTTSHELYSQAGLAKLFARVAGEARNSAPCRPTEPVPAYAMDAVMFKADWIPERTMFGLGYVSDHDRDRKTPPKTREPLLVTKKNNVSVDKGKACQQGLYCLAAITGASKASNRPGPPPAAQGRGAGPRGPAY
jgi:hypothetical protein